eukprot:CAMPEP_0168356338 /NCGR_PEP_ID=MMETSP0213-20121227/25091_1 /TAXON_ID=151035 /ORGANISM="Euplotes harpa, Strain FSP1.4" /LENGTH=77 /DNA_ID=CAMNT_0008368729 /DNA_START=1388 /DNA_END=1621 /DNA_ORIENTATION=+
MINLQLNQPELSGKTKRKSLKPLSMELIKSENTEDSRVLSSTLEHTKDRIMSPFLTNGWNQTIYSTKHSTKESMIRR